MNYDLDDQLIDDSDLYLGNEEDCYKAVQEGFYVIDDKTMEERFVVISAKE
jgi:hypothetical protein